VNLERAWRASATRRAAIFEIARASAGELLLLSRPLRGVDGARWALRNIGEFERPWRRSADHPAPALAECSAPRKQNCARRGFWAARRKRAAKPRWRCNILACTRLRELARAAGIERARYQFFLEQALSAAKNEGVPAPLRTAAARECTTACAAREVGTRRKSRAGWLRRRWRATAFAQQFEMLAACPFDFHREIVPFRRTRRAGEELSPLDAGTSGTRCSSAFTPKNSHGNSRWAPGGAAGVHSARRLP